MRFILVSMNKGNIGVAYRNKQKLVLSTETDKEKCYGK